MSKRPPAAGFGNHTGQRCKGQHLERRLGVHARQLREVVSRERPDEPGADDADNVLDARPEDRDGILEPCLDLIPCGDHDFLLKTALKMLAMNAPIEPSPDWRWMARQAFRPRSA